MFAAGVHLGKVRMRPALPDCSPCVRMIPLGQKHKTGMELKWLILCILILCLPTPPLISNGSSGGGSSGIGVVVV